MSFDVLQSCGDSIVSYLKVLHILITNLCVKSIPIAFK